MFTLMLVAIVLLVVSLDVRLTLVVALLLFVAFGVTIDGKHYMFSGCDTQGTHIRRVN